MTPGHVNLKRIAHIQKSVSEGFREETMQKLALKNAQNLNVLPMGRGPRQRCEGQLAVMWGQGVAQYGC